MTVLMIAEQPNMDEGEGTRARRAARPFHLRSACRPLRQSPAGTRTRYRGSAQNRYLSLLCSVPGVPYVGTGRATVRVPRSGRSPAGAQLQARGPGG
jgi:hypothetical protein